MSPLTWAAALALGEGLGFALARAASLAPVAALAAFFSLLFSYARARRALFLLFLLFLGLSLAFYTAHQRATFLRETTEFSRCRPCEATLRVEDGVRVTRGRFGRRTADFLSRIGTVKVRVFVPLARGAEPPRVGDKWHCVGWLQRLETDAFSRRRDFWVKGSGTTARPCPPTPGDLIPFFARVRHFASRRLAIGLEDDAQSANLLRALLLGERTCLPLAERTLFARAGTIHVFAISGLHVMILAQFLFLALTIFFRLPLRIAALFIVPLLWFYTATINFPPSAVRATTMASFYFAALFAWRRPHALVAWSLAFLSLHILHPEWLLDVGSLLSFVIMLALVLTGRLLAQNTTPIKSGLILSFAAWIAGAPLAALFFGRITPGGLFANLLLMPAAAASVVTGSLAFLTSFICPPLARHFNYASSLLLHGMESLSRTVAALPGAYFEIPALSRGTCLLCYLVLALTFLFFMLRQRHPRII